MIKAMQLRTKGNVLIVALLTLQIKLMPYTFPPFYKVFSVIIILSKYTVLPPNKLSGISLKETL